MCRRLTFVTTAIYQRPISPRTIARATAYELELYLYIFYRIATKDIAIHFPQGACVEGSDLCMSLLHLHIRN